MTRGNIAGHLPSLLEDDDSVTFRKRTEPVEWVTWRRGRDSNPRPDKREAVFKTAALNHSATPPVGQYRAARRRDQREVGRGQRRESRPTPGSRRAGGPSGAGG